MTFETERGKRFARKLEIQSEQFNKKLRKIDERITDLTDGATVYLYDLKQLSEELPPPDDDI